MQEENKPLLREKHKEYIINHDSKKEDFEYWATEHLRVSGYYWGYSALQLLLNPDRSETQQQTNEETENEKKTGWYSAYVSKEEAVEKIMKCYDEESGGFGGNEGHDPHLLYTLSAIQVLVLFDAVKSLPSTSKVVNFVASKQQADGSFAGDEWGEIDTRFSYIALSCLSLLNGMEAIDVEKAVEFVLSCRNFDGAFGVGPHTESHAGQTFCCVGALAITKQLHRIDTDLLGWWLCERQLPEGGLNGRPQKLPDVCYSWWVLSSLSCLDRLGWIDRDKLVSWILDCQDPDLGGFADRPDDAPDIYHTFFGLAGLSLLGFPNLSPIDPAYALPTDILARHFNSSLFHSLSSCSSSLSSSSVS